MGLTRTDKSNCRAALRPTIRAISGLGPINREIGRRLQWFVEKMLRRSGGRSRLTQSACVFRNFTVCSNPMFIQSFKLPGAVAILTTIAFTAFATLAESHPSRPARTETIADPFALAVRYETGEDYRRALALYCRAARSGDTRAYFNLGWMYFNGRGVARNDQAAEYWLRRAASRGVPQAQNLLRLLAGVEPAKPYCPDGTTRSVEAAGGRFPAGAPEPPAAIRAAIDEAADGAGLDDRLLVAIVTVESAFEPGIVSPKGAIGLMQLMPGTAQRFGVRDPFDYRENLRGGAAYLTWLLRKFDGDLPLALAAYNAGEQAVTTYGGVPPFRETTAYVEEVQRLCGCASAFVRAGTSNPQKEHQPADDDYQADAK